MTPTISGGNLVIYLLKKTLFVWVYIKEKMILLINKCLVKEPCWNDLYLKLKEERTLERSVFQIKSTVLWIPCDRARLC